LPSDEIVDPSRIRGIRRRHVLIRVGGPILGVLSVVVAIAALGLHSYQATRAGAVSLSRDLLEVQRRYVTQEVTDYLAPASAGATVARDLLQASDTGAEPGTFLAYSASMMTHVPQVASFYLADTNGVFWLNERNREGPGLEHTHLEMDTGKPVFRHWFYGEDGAFLKTTVAPATGFDPRQEVWFKGALAWAEKAGDGQLYWSRPYPFPPTKQLIVTAATVFHRPDGSRQILAVNILLAQLTTFLEQLKVGRSGKAVIVDRTGQLVAGVGMPQYAEPEGWDSERVRLDQKTQPVFTRALSMFRVMGTGGRDIDIRGRHYVAIAADLGSAAYGWVLLINAPESDFASFALTAGRQTFYFSVFIVGLASILAVFLVRQGRKTDRVTQALSRTREASASEHRALREIAESEGIFDPGHDMPRLTRILAEQSLASRASLWRFMDEGGRLVCEDLYDRAQDAHSTGLELSRRELEGFFDAVRSGDGIAVQRADQDETLRGFYRLVMRTHGTRAVVIEPVTLGGEVIGFILLEDAPRAEIVRHLTVMIADIVAIRLRAMRDDDGPLGDAERGGGGGFAGEPMHEFRFEDGFLLAPEGEVRTGRARDDGALRAGRYPMVPVMIVIFNDPDGQNSAVDNLELVRSMSRRMQEIARQYQLFSLQLIGRRLMLVGGCSETPNPDDAVRLADAALAIREAFLLALTDADIEPIFRIGIDVGPALGGYLGDDPAVFNLWGDAVSTSELMAQGVPSAGTIQVSEAAYSVLRSHYLFRPRGMFYLPRIGVSRSFLLAGRR